MAIARAEAKVFDPAERVHRHKLWVRIPTPGGVFVHVYWRRVGAAALAGAVALWLLGAAGVWAQLRYQRGWTEAPFWQVAFLPVRPTEFRLSLGRFYTARGVEEIGRRNYLAGREYLLAGLRHARSDLTVRRTVATQLALVFGLPQRAIDVLTDGLPQRPDLEYLTLLFGWMRESRQHSRILELARQLLPAAPDGELRHQFIALQEALVHFEHGRFAEAERVVVAWGLGASLEGQIVLARCEWEQGREAAALRRLEGELRRFGRRDELYAELVRLHRRAGQYEAARRFALLRQFNDPRSAAPRLDLIQGYLDTGEQTAREREVAGYLDQFGGDQNAVLLLARFAAQVGDEPLLDRVLVLARERGHRVDAVRMFQGLAAVLAGQYPRALEILLPPERPAPPAGAAATDRPADTTPPVVPRPPLWSGLRAAALLGAGERAEGSAELTALLDRLPPLGWEGLIVARELRRAGGSEPAARFLRRVAELDPLNEAARAELVRLELETGDRAALAAALDRVLAQARPPRGLLDEVLVRLRPPEDQALIDRLRAALRAAAAP